MNDNEKMPRFVPDPRKTSFTLDELGHAKVSFRLPPERLIHAAPNIAVERSAPVKPVTRFTIRDLDNVKPTPAPPRGIHLDHPRLAPPGMSGIKRFRVAPANTEVTRDKTRDQTVLGGQERATRAFKPLVAPSPAKSPERDR